MRFKIVWLKEEIDGSVKIDLSKVNVFRIDWKKDWISSWFEENL